MQDNNESNPQPINTPQNVETGHALSLPQPGRQHKPNIGALRFQNPGKNSISAIVGAYKSGVSKHANRLSIPFDWQLRFHDHIIRNEQAYNKITDYIVNNPAN